MPDHRSAALMTVMVSSPRRGHCPPSVHSACCPPSSPATLSPCHPLAHPPRALLVPTNQVAASPLPSPARSSVVGGASAVMEGRRWWGWSGVCLSRHRCRHLPPPNRQPLLGVEKIPPPPRIYQGSPAGTIGLDPIVIAAFPPPTPSPSPSLLLVVAPNMARPPPPTPSMPGDA